jgi:adenine nucleotide transporter 17
MSACISHIYGEEGILGFFRGLGPSLILVINPIIQYVIFEWSKMKIVDRRVLTLFVMGAFSKLISTIITYPLVTVKTRMYAEKASAQALIAEIMEKEGPAGFFKGMRSKMLYTILNAGFVMATQEKLQRSVAYMLRIPV